MSRQARPKRATISMALYAPAMADVEQYTEEGRRLVRPETPNNLTRTLAKMSREKVGRRERIRIRFDEKFADSYYASVSSPQSYRRKKPNVPNNTKQLEVDSMRQRIEEYKQTLAEHNERLQTQEMLTSIPALKAVQNIVQLDRANALQSALKVWKTYTYTKRELENKKRLIEKTYRVNSEDVVKSCISIAATRAVDVILASRITNEKIMTREFSVQKLNRARSKANTIGLDDTSGDGRISVFNMPAPDLSRYNRTKRGHQKQVQQLPAFREADKR